MATAEAPVLQDCDFYENPRTPAAMNPIPRARQLRGSMLFQVDIQFFMLTDEAQVASSGVAIVGSEGSTASPGAENVRCAMMLETIKRLVANGNNHLAMDHVVDYLDDLLIARDFPQCNAIFKAAMSDVDALSDPVMVSFLGITRAAKDKLPSRQKFYDRALRVVASRRGIDDATALLSRYL